MTTFDTAPRTRGRGATGSSDRIPVPTRQRRPLLAALALVLVLGGAALSAYLTITSGDKVNVVVMNANVKQGIELHRQDFKVVAMNLGGSQDFFSESSLNSLLAKRPVARMDLYKGTIFNGAMYVTDQAPGKGYTSIAIAVADGQYPTDSGGMQVGDKVKVIYTPSSDASKSSTGTAAGGNAPSALADLVPGQVLIDAAEVTAVSHSTSSSTGGVVLTLVIPDDTQAGNAAGNNKTKVVQAALANAQRLITVLRLPDTTVTQLGPDTP